MAYFVTGGTGFIGRFLIDRLVRRTGNIYVLVRKDSVKKLDALRPRWGEAEKRVVPIVGDLAKPRLGISPAAVRVEPRPEGSTLPDVIVVIGKDFKLPQ